MRLWSFQRDGFSLTGGQYDPKRSRYFLRYPVAYEELWRRIGRTFVIWCVISPDDWPSKRGHDEWELEVPIRGARIKIVDSLVWDTIRGENPGITERLRKQLDQEAQLEVGLDPDERQLWIENRVRNLRNPPGDPWDFLFLRDPTDVRASILLEHPIPESWVVPKESHSV